MSKQTKTISNAWEAEELIIKMMAQQDEIRTARDQARTKATNAVRDVQYQFYMCKATIFDNQFVELTQKIDPVAEFLIIPQ
ncbi:hypothetical protein [Pedobacter miscanthi]|uniref:hypothetical protein n=1 Tax=Pedobacter miscanthi TaxID=2259170 RepID=UPI002930B023|nr:hypothetical protein [Pedobacter miscanthi]